MDGSATYINANEATILWDYISPAYEGSANWVNTTNAALNFLDATQTTLKAQYAYWLPKTRGSTTGQPPALMPGMTLKTYCLTDGKVIGAHGVTSSSTTVNCPLPGAGVPNLAVSSSLATETLWPTASLGTDATHWAAAAGRTVLTRPQGFATVGSAVNTGATPGSN